MPELAPIRQPTGLPTQLIERAPNRTDLSLWNRLLAEFSNASNELDRAALLLENIYTTWGFAKEQSLPIEPFSPELEEQFFSARDELEKIKRAIRMVEDHKLGIQPTGDGDINILEIPEATFSGLIIPVIAGLVILGTAIAATVYQTRQLTELTIKYAHLLKSTNDVFCANPNSSTCSQWKATKKARKYEQNETLADSLKKGIKTVAGGAATGLLLAVAALIFLRRK